MSNVFYIGDLHLGHRKILNFSPQRGGLTTDEHDEWIIDQWNSVVGKNDMVWVLGDVAFSNEALTKVTSLRGHKKLVRGNHDQQNTQTYLKYFNNVYGIVKDNGMWLSHAPIHPQELRGRANVHGHVHSNSILAADGSIDHRYINVSVENINGVPISYEQLKAHVPNLDFKAALCNLGC